MAGNQVNQQSKPLRSTSDIRMNTLCFYSVPVSVSFMLKLKVCVEGMLPSDARGETGILEVLPLFIG